MADGESGDCQGNVQKGTNVKYGGFPLDGDKAFSHPQKKGNDENDAEEPAAKKRRDMILPVAVADGLPVFVSQIKRIEVKGDDGKKQHSGEGNGKPGSWCFFWRICVFFPLPLNVSVSAKSGDDTHRQNGGGCGGNDGKAGFQQQICQDRCCRKEKPEPVAANAVIKIVKRIENESTHVKAGECSACRRLPFYLLLSVHGRFFRLFFFKLKTFVGIGNKKRALPTLFLFEVY